MITKELISPQSIVVVGGSDDTTKPGGNALKNLIDTGYKGELRVVNPKSEYIQGIKAYKTPEHSVRGNLNNALKSVDEEFITAKESLYAIMRDWELYKQEKELE